MTATPVDLAVVICTYRRPDPLRRLLDQLLVESAASTDLVRLGVSVADDGPDGEAHDVVAAFADRFDLGVRYTNTASGNISVARNAAIDGGLELGEWLAFIDDDCMPSEGWLRHLFAMQERTNADLVTGPIHDIAPAGAPRWVTDQPFLNMIAPYVDGEEPPYGTTANVLIRSSWLREHPGIRFRPELGKLGGEDMVWFEAARAAGIVHRYSIDAVVTEQIPLERTRYRYQLRNKLWFGNTMYVTNAEGGTNPNRLFVRGARHFVEGLLRPFRRLLRRESPQLRYAVAAACIGVGMMSGRLGVRLDHH